jgi:hypothetical protein
LNFRLILNEETRLNGMYLSVVFDSTFVVLYLLQNYIQIVNISRKVQILRVYKVIVKLSGKRV